MAFKGRLIRILTYVSSRWDYVQINKISNPKGKKRYNSNAALKVQRIHISNIVFTVLQNLMTFVEKYGSQVFDVRDILMPVFVF